MGLEADPGPQSSLPAKEPLARGSAMSSKQFAAQSVFGRRISCRWDNHSELVVGYIVGMDDYHILVLVSNQEEPSLSLIPKNSPHRIALSLTETLSGEPEEIKNRAEQIGGAFRRSAAKHYFNRDL